MCLIVVLFSIIDYFSILKFELGWAVERLGFCYGIILASKNIEIKEYLNEKWLEKLLCNFIISLILGVIYIKYKPVHFYGDYLLRIIVGAAITIFIMLFLSRFFVGNRTNKFIGSVSYETYLIHTIVFSQIMFFDKNHFLNSAVFIWLSILITISSSYFVKTISNACLRCLTKK